MAYDELTQSQLDRLTEGFKRRIAELERQLEAALRVTFEGGDRAPDPNPTPPVSVFSVRRG